MSNRNMHDSRTICTFKSRRHFFTLQGIPGIVRIWNPPLNSCNLHFGESRLSSLTNNKFNQINLQLCCETTENEISFGL